MKIFKKILPLLMVFALVKPVYAATDIYVVKPGDSLWIIAQKYQVGLSEIIEANDQFTNPDLIYPGDRVAVPLRDQAELSLEREVLALVNKERGKNGAAPLSLNWELSRVARYKAEEMRDSNYFSHTSPVYGSPFDMIKNFGIKYSSAGENIAKGQKTAQAVMASWMASEGHRANILNKNFSQLGVGFAQGGGSTYWAQMFIRP